MNTLISSEDLGAHLTDPNWLVFDCRFSLVNDKQGFEHYCERHIAGARYVHLNRDLSGNIVPGKTGRHPLPDRNLWLEQLKRWGIDPGKQVVAYDDVGGAFAVRLWWLLRWIGHSQVALLDGGWQSWCAQRRPVTHGNPEPDSCPPTEASYQGLPSLTRQVTIEDLMTGNYLLIDARDEARYRGEVEPIDPIAGHIPGALCFPYAGNLTADGYFKSPLELKRRFSTLKDTSTSQKIACYCGSGVTAIHNILAMVHAGMPEPALYPGSWSEWILNPTRPIER